MFCLDGVEFAYPEGQTALVRSDFRVRAGERIAIVGANGCGKSTLLKLLDALVFPTSGRFTAFGEPVTEHAFRDREAAWRFRRRVGLVFQNSDAQLFSPTVREEIAFGPLQLGLPVREVEKRVADIAAMLGVQELLDRTPFRLSGGEKKKVALGAVLAVNPQVILLDEPTNGLDPRSQHWLNHMLSDLHRAGKTLIVATHDLSIVPLLADRVVVMNEQHGLEADGLCHEILNDRSLLLRVNLIHEHSHWHGPVVEPHTHGEKS